jgi:hypothetical protein
MSLSPVNNFADSRQLGKLVKGDYSDDAFRIFVFFVDVNNLVSMFAGEWSLVMAMWDYFDGCEIAFLLARC